MASLCQVGLVGGVVVLVPLVGVPFVGRCRVFDRGAGLGGPSSVPVPGVAVGDVSSVEVGAWHIVVMVVSRGRVIVFRSCGVACLWIWLRRSEVGIQSFGSKCRSAGNTVVGGWGSWYGEVFKGFWSFLCSCKKITGSFPGVSFMTIIGPWRVEASACMCVSGYW